MHRRVAAASAKTDESPRAMSSLWAQASPRASAAWKRTRAGELFGSIDSRAKVISLSQRAIGGALGNGELVVVMAALWSVDGLAARAHGQKPKPTHFNIELNMMAAGLNISTKPSAKSARPGKRRAWK